MRKSELLGLLGLGIGSVLMMTQRGSLFVVGTLVLVGTFVWYALSGYRMRGWAGPSEEELRARLAAIEEAMKSLEGSLDNYERRHEWVRLDSARFSILHQLTARARAMGE